MRNALGADFGVLFPFILGTEYVNVAVLSTLCGIYTSTSHSSPISFFHVRVVVGVLQASSYISVVRY